MLMNKLNNCLYNTDHGEINHQIARFIKKNLPYINEMTIDEIASACFVSKAKISKFCKDLGYDNFIAFKDDCVEETKAKRIVIDSQSENLEIQFQTHIHQSLRTIENNLCQINQNEIEKLVKDIFEASYIFLYGGAYSHLLCQYMQYECDFIGKDVIVLDEKLIKDYVMKEKSLLIVMSVEGHTLDDQRLLRRLKKYPVKKWLLSTALSDPLLIDQFDCSVIVPAQATEVKDRRLLIRYLIDIIMGRYQYLYVSCAY